MGASRKYDHEAVLSLRQRGRKVCDIAKSLKIRSAVVSSILRMARERGDERAALKPKAEPEPALERDDVIVVCVPTTDRDHGMNRKAAVSLPRLSILGDWTGAAS
jgi:phosphoglycerate dehydrogenase-like enzyme